MKIGVIQASSQASKNSLIYNTVRKYAPEAEVINFGCTEEEQERYSYIEISLLAGMLLAGGAVDFIVTGCSSGQGMMLACNSFPGVLCGYAPTPVDAYLFAQINNGNAVSLPLGEEYSWTGPENFEATIARLFSEPFGQGWPKGESARKLRDTELLKSIRRSSQVSAVELLNSLDKAVVESILRKQNVVRYILEHGNEEIKNTIQNYEFRIQN
ncbi:RpiB/LacA/LacB family sugar-phosphate isomerase [Aristaeella hokkaidonensis]|uniref:RpiB/LacA/LacB family sugar-phosphate isomerase n=1 Tax=Aristaeella hokkaidonensis TaxID=3046382 RepID=A0AC61MUX8_9FIRM|nr:RpiB/LacA/LacB family sugar-phosphate isomerase [Aristaeella hokkaidonensis]QUC66215.1 RpiB/LacA/LacB family sugar-phosphate isomerase [Aristaeella hokkaidonensis]SNT94777.1 Ribose 5-phosphate isomerase RpiB [Aristaeella hokkaidonensis]